jgi:NAD(P)H-nitrite reductase large subunit
MAARTQPHGIAPHPENVCICFHVPLAKIVKFIRLEKPRVASQVAGCYGAGTGCGWCIPFLEKVFEQMQDQADREPDLGLTMEEYMTRRREYLRKINATRMRDAAEELKDSGDLIE